MGLPLRIKGKENLMLLLYVIYESLFSHPISYRIRDEVYQGENIFFWGGELKDRLQMMFCQPLL